MKSSLLVLSMIAVSCAESPPAKDNFVPGDTAVKPAGKTPKYRITTIVETIRFSHNSSAVASNDKELLKYLAGVCSSDSVSSVKVFGFTDTTGTEKRNDQLSEHRAMAVHGLLGLDKYKGDNSVYVTWLGESAETYDLHFDSAHAQQNCVDILILTRKKLDQ
jgi:outer membrane protein OmpA-like peptidoglycan-associated protein